jgi:large subunit ribosomal protein L24
MKLRKGDKVKILTGKDRGKEGAVERVWPKEAKVAVAGVNVYKRHSKPKTEGQKGGIIDFARPLAFAKVALVCPKCKQVTRVGYKLTDDKKVRICRKCDQEI